MFKIIYTKPFFKTTWEALTQSKVEIIRLNLSHGSVTLGM